MYNTLIIAPSEQGPYRELTQQKASVRQVQNALRGVVLDGPLTAQQIVDAIASQRWDIVWFECHGNKGGIPLNPKEFLNFSDLTAHVRQAGAVLCFINTCESELSALQIHYELGIDVIATIAPVEDATAYRTGTFLAKNLASGMSIHDAFEKSRPGQDSVYKLFSDNTLNRMTSDSRQLMQAINDLANRLSSQIDDVRGDVQELRKEVKGLSGDVAEVKKEVALLKVTANPTPLRKWAWALGFLALFLPVPLFYSDVRTLVGIHWPAALVVATGAYVVSAGLFGYGTGIIQESFKRIYSGD